MITSSHHVLTAVKIVAVVVKATSAQAVLFPTRPSLSSALVGLRRDLLSPGVSKFSWGGLALTPTVLEAGRRGHVAWVDTPLTCHGRILCVLDTSTA